MHVIAYKTIAKFTRKHADSRSAFDAFYSIILDASWGKFEDVKKTFGSADTYKECTIFDVGGNKYRLIAKINYRTQTVYIKRILTHAEYSRDKWKKNC